MLGCVEHGGRDGRCWVIGYSVEWRITEAMEKISIEVENRGLIVATSAGTFLGVGPGKMHASGKGRKLGISSGYRDDTPGQKAREAG